MEKALGVGGIFLRARDPKMLAEWYRKNLGIETFDDAGSGAPWMTEAGRDGPLWLGDRSRGQPIRAVAA